MFKPHRLQPGDTIATVSLSWGGPGTFPYRYEAGKKQLESAFGVQVVEMPHTLSDAEWLEHNPQARAEDLLQAFSDPSINAIFSTIGGDDSIRILPYLDLEVIRSNPKIFMGCSDTTISHLVCYKAGLCSFYGPSIMAGFAENGGLFPYMVKSVRKTLFSNESIGVIEPNNAGWTNQLLNWADSANQSQKRKLNPGSGWKYLQGKGTHRGHLIGGCFEVLDWLRGTPFWPETTEWQDAILFLDTSEDAPPPIAVERGLRTYAAMGILEKLSGILFGRPGGDIPLQDFDLYDQALLQVVRNEQGLVDLPIITNMDFGHTDPMFVLPYGIQAEVNCEKKTFAISENAVIE
ncbi:MAG: S66 peptidase family protein [Anaerolineaceae bacterium]